MNSTKTTLFGLLAGIGGGVTGAYLSKPDLLAHFPAWLSRLGVLMTSIGTACLGLAARDNNKTSEQVGAGGPTGVLMGGRPIVSLLMVGLLSAGSFGSIITLAGCAGTPSRIAYDTVAAPAIAVDKAMTAWGDYVGLYHPSAAVELKVKAAFERYQAVELLAIDAAQAYATMTSIGATNGLGEAQLNALLSSETAANALADPVNLLRKLGVTI